MTDDPLLHFAANGALPLPAPLQTGVVLLHGGLGHSGNWGYQVPALLGAGYQVILIDSRGHGRSTRDRRPFTYELMASDVLAVLDELGIAKASLVGWSDGACTALILHVQDYAQLSATPDQYRQ